MILRRKCIQKFLLAGEKIFTMTCFPRMGTPGFTEPWYPPTPYSSDGASLSSYIPDEVLSRSMRLLPPQRTVPHAEAPTPLRPLPPLCPPVPRPISATAPHRRPSTRTPASRPSPPTSASGAASASTSPSPHTPTPALPPPSSASATPPPPPTPPPRAGACRRSRRRRRRRRRGRFTWTAWALAWGPAASR
jgi:hypothetical protein